MKSILAHSSILILILSIPIMAKTADFKHFEIRTSAMYWAPSDPILKMTYSMAYTRQFPFIIHPDLYVHGYGNDWAPTVTLGYYFKNNMGITLGGNYLNPKNLYTLNGSYWVDSIYIFAKLTNLRLGLSFRTNDTSAVNFYGEFGLNYMHNLSTGYISNIEPYYRHDSITTNALGIYLSLGYKIHLIKFISLYGEVEYSYIPSKEVYPRQSKKEKTDIGGIGIKTGIAINF